MERPATFATGTLNSPSCSGWVTFFFFLLFCAVRRCGCTFLHFVYIWIYMLLFLQDSLGGNAKTYIIANVHPGSKCFGETLSTLHFAQRAKLIKNKVYQNETQRYCVQEVGYRLCHREYKSLILFILSWQAIINEDTQGNVRQLQAEVKKLKEQLARALASQAGDCGKDVAPGGPALHSGI